MDFRTGSHLIHFDRWKSPAFAAWQNAPGKRVSHSVSAIAVRQIITQI